MSAPRTKRQFAGAASDPAQRQITSFFGPSSTASSSSSASIYSAANIPHLPSSVQSNLISVGMRVRKSVPEGYKTGSYSAFSLWEDSNPAINGDMGNTGDAMAVDSRRSRSNAMSAGSSTPRELTPFCGLHKVGGMAAQPQSNLLSAYQPIITVSGTNEDMEVPGLTMSQESATSTDGNASPASGGKTRKRFFVEDEEEQATSPSFTFSLDRLNVGRGGLPDGEVSPRSLAPAGWENARVMAVPRKNRLRKGLSPSGASAEPRVVDQENMSANGDFGEADFLDTRTWGEVEMSDA